MDIFRVSFIGHRVVDEYRQVEEELDEVIELLHRKYGFIDFNVGRNGEFDDLATQAVRRFRREWEEWCELTLVEPYPVANLDIIEKSYDSVIIPTDNGDQMVSYNGQDCVYDVMGNPTMYRGKTATWVNGRCLASFDGHTFTYDGQGRRLTKDSVVFAYDSNGRLIKQGDNMEFFYDQTGVVGLKYGATTYLYRKDAQGNVIALIGENGAIVARYLYDAWGNVSVVDNNGTLISDSNHIGNVNPFRYRAYYYDTETKLYFLKTRYYDPEIGRFVTIDGIQFLTSKVSNGLNLYSYCYNNPVYYIDKTGTSPEVSTEVDIWSLYNFKNYIWRSGRYQPRRTYKISNNPFKYLGNNLLFAGELFLSKFELNFGGYEFTALNFNTGVTILSAGFDLLDGRVYFSDTDYLGIKVGSVNLDIIDIQPMENNYTILDAQATALTVGAYSEYVDAELLVGSVGATLKFKDGKFTFGFSLGIGFKITIKFW